MVTLRIFKGFNYDKFNIFNHLMLRFFRSVYSFCYSKGMLIGAEKILFLIY